MILLALVVFAIIASTDPARHFSPDSWTLFELSSSVFNDFYHIQTIREYAFASEYSASFPPLMPVLTAMVMAVMPVDTGAGLLLNGLFAIGTAWLLSTLTGRLYGNRWLGVLLLLILLANRHYIYSLRGVHSMVLYLFLLAALYTVVLKKQALGWRDAGMAGLLGGLLALTRFDGLVYAIALLPVIVWFAKERIKAGAIYLILLFATLAPWMAYCYSHFGVFFASDNSRGLWAVDHIFVLDYLTQPYQTIHDNFGKWFENAWRDAEAFLGIAFTKLIFAPFVLGLIYIVTKKMGAKYTFRVPALNKKQLALFVPLAAQMGLVGISGYHEARYLLPVQLALLIYFLGFVDWDRLKPGKLLNKHGQSIFIGLCLLIAVIYMGGTLAKGREVLGAFRNPETPAEFAKINECSKSRPEAPMMLVGDRLSYRFAAYRPGMVYLEPYGIPEAGWPAYFERFGIRYVLLPQNQTIPLKHVRNRVVCTLSDWGKKEGGLAFYEILAYRSRP